MFTYDHTRLVDNKLIIAYQNTAIVQVGQWPDYASIDSLK